MKLTTLYEMNAEMNAFGVDALEKHLKDYIKSNKESDLKMIQNLCHRNPTLNKVLEREYPNHGVFYRGICGKGECPSVDTCLAMEKTAMFNSVTTDHEVALKYANKKSPDWKYIITYKVPHSGIVVDIGLFNLLFNKNVKHESEVIINIHACSYMDVKKIG